MITGQINANLEAVIPLVVQGQGEAVLALNVVIDTGYSDFLTLPAETIATLGLEQAATGVLTLADGSKVVSAIYLATVIWDGLPRHDITVDALEFDVGHNKYRLIAWVSYKTHKVFIRSVMTHAEYDQDKWKSDC